MHGLKSTAWLACALIWGFNGWQIVPAVFASNPHDGFMVGLAFCVAVLSCLGWALEHLEKVVRA
jgi:hypothetical protein